MANDLEDAELASLGFSLQGVLLTSSLPESVLSEEVSNQYSQLLVFAHGGTRLWNNVTLDGQDPIDSFSLKHINAFMGRIDVADYEILYPGAGLDLLAIGEKLRWYDVSPMGIGIHAEFGTWFAFRAVVAANTGFAESSQVKVASPCESCMDKPCVSSCPVGAVRRDAPFQLQTCIEERTREGSACQYQCLARLACPVGSQHQYAADQLRYHYGRSLSTIRLLRDERK